MRKQGFATYIALTLLTLLIGLVFMATVAGSYAANIVSSTLARTKEAKILAQIHNADALRSLVYLDYRTTSLDSQSAPGAVSAPGGRDALIHLCRNKPSYLAYSWFYEPRMRPPSAQVGLSDCPLLLVNDYVGQALSTPPPPVLRSTYSIYHSTTALITAIAPHLSNGGPPLLEYAFTPVLVKSVWSNPDPYYLFPFSPFLTPLLSEGSIIDAPGILSPFRNSDEFGVFRDDMGRNTSQAPATFIAPIGMPEIRTPTSPSTFTRLNCSTTGPSAPRCDSLGYAYDPTSPTFSLSLPYLYWTTRGRTSNQVLLPPQIYFGLDQVSLTNRSAPKNPFVGGFSYFAAPLQRGTDYQRALPNAIYSTYYTGLSADQSFFPLQDFEVYLGVDQNRNQVVEVREISGRTLYQERFPPEGPYTTRVLDFSGGFRRTVHIKRLPGSRFAMNGRVNLDLVIRAGQGRSIVLWDDLTMENGSCDSPPTWQQGVPIPASCPRRQLMLLHLVSSDRPIYLSAVKNWVLNGVVVAMAGGHGFDYLSSVPYTTTKTDIYVVGAWFGGQPVMSDTRFPLPRLFLTAPELERSQRIWPRLPYPLHINALQVLGGHLFSQ
jgi:hypothetical protein